MKAKKLICVVIGSLILIISSCKYNQSKPYDFSCNNDSNLIISRADSLKKAGDLPAAIKLYKMSYNESKASNIAYSLAYSYALLENRDSSFHFLTKAVRCDSSLYRLFSGELFSLMEDPRWKEIKELQMKKFEAKFGAFSNRNLTGQLLELKMRDQAYYYQVSTKPDSVDFYWSLKYKINEENLDKVEQIIKEYGWPRKSYVGIDASSGVFIVLQHCGKIDIMKKYLPLLQKLVKEGEADGSQLALMVDRINKHEGRKQVYGTQVSYDTINKVYFLDNVIDPDNLNKRRAEMGLEPIEEYLKNWDAELRL